MKLNKQAAEVVANAIETIQGLLSEAYLDDEESSITIYSDRVDIIGVESEVLESNCTPQKAVERLIEDQP